MDEHLAFRAGAEDVERFRLAAALDGRTQSEALRHLIRQYAARVAAQLHNEDDPQTVEDLRAAETPFRGGAHATPG